MLDDDEKGYSKVSTPGGRQQMTVINEQVAWQSGIQSGANPGLAGISRGQRAVASLPMSSCLWVYRLCPGLERNEQPGRFPVFIQRVPERCMPVEASGHVRQRTPVTRATWSPSIPASNSLVPGIEGILSEKDFELPPRDPPRPQRGGVLIVVF